MKNSTKTMVMKKQYFCIVTFLIVFLLFTSIISPLQELSGLENGFLTGYEDVEIANQSGRFGAFKSELVEREKTVGGQKVKQGEIVFKLFGFIPIKKVDVRLSNDDEYYVGGVPIGLSICTDGAIVLSEENGNIFKEGDIITKINGQELSSLESFSDYIKETPEEVEVEFIRKNKPYKTLVKTIKDENGDLKLGIWVKDDVAGIGTLTFVNKNTFEYGALGHPIVELNSGSVIPVAKGNVFECNLIGIDKGKKNDPGELRCVFVASDKSKGTIISNSKFGIKGVLNEIDNLVDENLTAKIGGRLGVKMGAAKIVSSVSGIREEYDIEIIKANYQKSANDKSIVFRVKDKRLLELTGGIVQGMSGSPIMQDGKIVGAVTHVFLNDPTKGYGVYTDFML